MTHPTTVLATASPATLQPGDILCEITWSRGVRTVNRVGVVATVTASEDVTCITLADDTSISVLKKHYLVVEKPLRMAGRD